MKPYGLLLVLLTVTVVPATLATLKPTSATEQSNNQHSIMKKQSTLLLAAEIKGNKPSKPNLDTGAKAQARSQAVQSPGYVERGKEIQRLITQLNKMKPQDLKRVKVRNQIKRLNKEREDIVRHYEDIQRGLQNRAS